MKLTALIASLIPMFCASSAYADVTVNITGSSSFRAAALNSIKSCYRNSQQPFKFAHDQPYHEYANATRAIFIGTFPGVTGTTTIRCCFTGSVIGIRALCPVTDPAPPTYYQPFLLTGTTATVDGAELANQGTTGATALGGQSDIAFSDVAKETTPYSSYSLQPSSPVIGVGVFTMLTNEGSPVTNVTTQQWRALMSGGLQPLSLFTCNHADTSYVFATGRNDGSGTRTTYMAETGYGVANVVKQYVTVSSTSTALKAIQLVPAGGVNDEDPLTAGVQLPTGSDIQLYQAAGNTVTQSTANTSTVWGLNVDGNGGYNSGSVLRTDMGKTGASGVTVFDETGTDVFGSTVRADLVTWVSLNDAVTARTNGAVFCAYNGVKLNDIAAAGTTMSATDKAKVTEGGYTAWSYERMYRSSWLSGDPLTVYDVIKTNLSYSPYNPLVRLADMHVGRVGDGGIVAP